MAGDDRDFGKSPICASKAARPFKIWLAPFLAAMLIAACQPAAAQVNTPVPCTAFSGFPLTIKLGAQVGNTQQVVGSESVACANAKIMAAINTLAGQRGQPNGIATLDPNGLISPEQSKVSSAIMTRGAPYYASDVLKRRLHALDDCSLAERIDIMTYTGALDARACLQAAVNHAQAAGKSLVLDAGFWNIKTGRVAIPMGLLLEGEGWGELPIIPGGNAPASPNHGTVVNFDYLASLDPYGFFVTGSGVTIRNVEFRQTQPTPAPGWQPNVGPWAVYAYAVPFQDDGGHRLSVERVMLRNVYDGINTGITRGGTFSDIYGQPLHTGFRTEVSVDQTFFSNIRLGWTYWSGQADVRAWQLANRTMFDFLRTDGPQMQNIFVFESKIGLKCSQQTDPYAPGNCNRLEATNLYLDDVQTGILAEDGADITVTNFHGYAHSTTPGSSCLANVQRIANDYYQPAKINITNGDCEGSNGPAFSFAWSPAFKPAVHSLSNVRVRSFNLGNTSSPAIWAVPGVTIQKSNLTVDSVTDPARIFGGGGKLIIPGSGVVGGAGWAEMTNGMILQWGKNAGNTTVTFPRACASIPYSVTATPEFAASAANAETVTVSNVGTTGFTLNSRFLQASGVSGAGEASYWQVVCQLQ